MALKNDKIKTAAQPGASFLLALDKAVDAKSEPCTTTENFLGVLQIAEKSDGTKSIHYPDEILSPHVDNRIRGGTWTPVGEGTLSAILAGVELCPPETLAELRKLQTDYDALAERQTAFSQKNANLAFDGQRSRMVERAQAGNLPGPEDAPYREREAFQTDWRLRWDAIGEVLSKLHRQVAELAIPIWEKAAKAVFDSMLTLERDEKAGAEKFDLPWLSSNIYRAHATGMMFCHKRLAALKNFRAGVQGFSHCPPRFAVENLIKI